MSQSAKVRAFATVLAPCAIVLTLRAFSGVGPAASSAATANPPSSILPPAPVEQTPANTPAASRAILERIALLRSTSNLPSPMDHPPEPAVQPEGDTQPAGPTTPSPAPTPGRVDLRLTATMGSGASAGALINGKFVRIGDIISGHEIISIDAAAFTVILKAEDGTERILRRR